MTADSSALIDRLRAAPDVTRPSPGAGVPGTAPSRLWYVSYGSNLLRARFLTYLLGGRPDGSTRDYPVSGEPQPPAGETALLLPGSVGFARDAPSWGGGGVAFWDPDAGWGTPARGWLVSLCQFEELLHMENGGLDRRRMPVPEQLWSEGACTVGDGWYPRLVLLGQVHGEPAVTFTSAAGPVAASPPGPAYAGVVARGITETFGARHRGAVTVADAAGYVADLAGGRGVPGRGTVVA